MKPRETVDRLGLVLDSWRVSRPDLDFSPLEVTNRVLRAAHLIHTRFDRIAAAYGLSHRGDLDTLIELELVGPMTPSQLAEDLLLTSGGMTVRLNRLQAAGLVERQPNPKDGRGVLVHLTSVGTDLARDALGTLLEAHGAVVGALDQTDQSRLAKLLRSLLTELGDLPPFSPRIVAKPVERQPDR
jgi:DNA-binding MarR family transcriptional regulator